MSYLEKMEGKDVQVDYQSSIKCSKQ